MEFFHTVSWEHLFKGMIGKKHHREIEGALHVDGSTSIFLSRLKTPMNKKTRCVFFLTFWVFHMDVSENSGTPKSSILIRFSIINHPFWGAPILGNTHIYLAPYLCQSLCFNFTDSDSLKTSPTFPPTKKKSRSIKVCIYVCLFTRYVYKVYIYKGVYVYKNPVTFTFRSATAMACAMGENVSVLLALVVKLLEAKATFLGS